MKTAIVLNRKNEGTSRIRSLRFNVNNAPSPNIKDTIRLNCFEPFSRSHPPEVEKRHWEGKTLVLSCATEDALLDFLVGENPSASEYASGHYTIADQDWIFTPLEN